MRLIEAGKEGDQLTILGLSGGACRSWGAASLRDFRQALGTHREHSQRSSRHRHQRHRRGLDADEAFLPVANAALAPPNCVDTRVVSVIVATVYSLARIFAAGAFGRVRVLENELRHHGSSARDADCARRVRRHGALRLLAFDDARKLGTQQILLLLLAAHAER